MERIEREHVPLPRCEIKREGGGGGGGGGGEGEMERGAPPAQQDMCHSLRNSDAQSPQSPAPARFHQTPFRI